MRCSFIRRAQDGERTCICGLLFVERCHRRLQPLQRLGAHCVNATCAALLQVRDEAPEKLGPRQAAGATRLGELGNPLLGPVRGLPGYWSACAVFVWRIVMKSAEFCRTRPASDASRNARASAPPSRATASAPSSCGIPVGAGPRARRA